MNASVNITKRRRRNGEGLAARLAKAERENLELGDDLLDAEGRLTDVGELFDEFCHEIKVGWSLRAQLLAEDIARRLGAPRPVISGEQR